MNRHIYLGEIPHNERGAFWVSFESDPHLAKTRSNIYGKCLPCIQNLYEQLKKRPSEIDLGPAFHCWKVTAVLDGIEECLSLLSYFETRFPIGHVFGKFGSGRPDSDKKVVVFHTENKTERDRIQNGLTVSLKELDIPPVIRISRGCAILHEPILGDWQSWQARTPIQFPERIRAQLELVKRILYRSTM